MKSMTGYGRGDCSQDGFKITVELSSVNRKQTEISVNLPREMELLEAPIRDVINRHVARGRLTVRVSVHTGCNAPMRAERDRETLLERNKVAGLETPPADDERSLKEVVYFADRSDITEELTRLQSHFQQFEDCLKSKEPVGRMLDFLAQEMNREANTIGSKAIDSLISPEVVTLKAELEKFREQAQNVD